MDHYHRIQGSIFNIGKSKMSSLYDITNLIFHDTDLQFSDLQFLLTHIAKTKSISGELLFKPYAIIFAPR